MPYVVEIACPDDIPAWLELAADAEAVFGCSLATDSDYQQALTRTIENKRAYCIRGIIPSHPPLLGGLLFSTKHHPLYKLGWLSVHSQTRHIGIGRALVLYAIQIITPPAELIVETFTIDYPAGKPARKFYESLGMIPSEILPGKGPNGSPVQIYRLFIH